nr:unnamed protein product [Digitaria exilis]
MPLSAALTAPCAGTGPAGYADPATGCVSTLESTHLAHVVIPLEKAVSRSMSFITCAPSCT